MGLDRVDPAIDMDPPGRSVSVVDAAYTAYLDKTNPGMAEKNRTIARHDAESRLAYLLELHDRQEAARQRRETSSVAQAIEGDTSYIAERATVASSIEREPTEV